jgi:hypothetical protein
MKIADVLGSIRIVYLGRSDHFVIDKAGLDASSIFELECPFSILPPVFVGSLICEEGIVVGVCPLAVSKFAYGMDCALVFLSRG